MAAGSAYARSEQIDAGLFTSVGARPLRSSSMTDSGSGSWTRFGSLALEPAVSHQRLRRAGDDEQTTMSRRNLKTAM
jgi:hypothetical protein